MVYKLVHKHKKDGVEAYKAKKAGKPKTSINPSFVKKVAEIRKSTDYGSEKLHFVLKKSGFGVSQHIIQRILNEQGNVLEESRRLSDIYVFFNSTGVNPYFRPAVKHPS